MTAPTPDVHHDAIRHLLGSGPTGVSPRLLKLYRDVLLVPRCCQSGATPVLPVTSLPQQETPAPHSETNDAA